MLLISHILGIICIVLGFYIQLSESSKLNAKKSASPPFSRFKMFVFLIAVASILLDILASMGIIPK